MFFKNTVIPRNQIIGDMPRYISQRDRYNCGPVAVVNYWKYLGLNVSYKDVKVLGRILETKRSPIGTYTIALANLLGKVWKNVSLEELSLPAIVLYGNHYWFCAYKRNNGFIGINYCDHETYHIISTRRMKSILKKAEVLLLGEANV